MHAETHLVLSGERHPPDALGVHRGPVGPVEPRDPAGAGEVCAGRRDGEWISLDVLEIVEAANHQFAVQGAACIGLEREGIRQLLLHKIKIGRRKPGAPDGGIAAIGRISVRIAQIALHARLLVILEKSDGVDRLEPVVDVECRLGLQVAHVGVQEAACADHVGGRVGAAELRDRPGGAGRRPRCRVERLAIAALEIGRDEHRERVPAIAERDAGLVGAVGVLGLVEIEGLERFGLLEGELRLVRRARGDLQHAADGVARVHGGERAIEKVDALDFLRRNHAPARCGVAVVVAEQVRQQDVIGIDQCARTGAQAPGARGEHGLIVASVSLAHKQTRQIFDRVLGIDHVDRLVDLLPRDPFGGLRKLILFLHRRGSGDKAAPGGRRHRQGRWWRTIDRRDRACGGASRCCALRALRLHNDWRQRRRLRGAQFTLRMSDLHRSKRHASDAAQA